MPMQNEASLVVQGYSGSLLSVLALVTTAHVPASTLHSAPSPQGGLRASSHQ